MVMNPLLMSVVIGVVCSTAIVVVGMLARSMVGMMERGHLRSDEVAREQIRTLVATQTTLVSRAMGALEELVKPVPPTPAEVDQAEQAQAARTELAAWEVEDPFDRFIPGGRPTAAMLGDDGFGIEGLAPVVRLNGADGG